ncbi:hypothetical protein BpHYR1_020643 [Brachionus plicatilis]|uniref:Uncharacterized protein n=1 Tax=Brachionus plicatilis TaxID=10195 RepID=A0A3M7QCC6_BRAPC|nr:hypothetical protein BpHYR1_020643 [Brachionus plicatilis]
MIYKQIIDNFRQATPLENSFQDYNMNRLIKILVKIIKLMHKNLQMVQNIVADLVVLQLKKEIQKIVLSENQKESEKTKIDISITGEKILLAEEKNYYHYYQKYASRKIC